MDITKLSTKYKVCRLTEKDIDIVLELCMGNPLFYQYCPPAPTKESIAHDMAALPPGTKNEDKYYLGIYEEDKLIAVLDLILNYPNENTAFIGCFMVSSERQKKGLGTMLIKEMIDCLLINGYAFTKLGYVKGNPQAKAFWFKNGFVETGLETITEDYTIVISQRSNESKARQPFVPVRQNN